MSGEESLRARLAELVAFDTQNPSGDEEPLVAKLSVELHALGATTVETLVVGRHRGVFAAFGAAPRILINAHVDTVPASHGYTAPPLGLVERGGRLYGLGSADTKGAIAAVMEALATRPRTPAAPGSRRDVAVLFSGDEEVGCTVSRAFLASDLARGIERVVVCEPTGCRAGVRHRGIGAARAMAISPGGHSSRADDLPAPVVTAARGAVALHAWGRSHLGSGPPGFRGLCLNVAAIEGGLAFNVVPSRATLTVSLRPWPGADIFALLGEAERAARDAAAPDEIDWQVSLANPPFSTRDAAAFVPLLGDVALTPTDLHFWTEAALFSAAGIDAVVFGPGEIAQAHAPDEFVELAQLAAARDVFLRLVS